MAEYTITRPFTTWCEAGRNCKKYGTDEIWGFQRVAGDNLRAHIYQIRKIVDKPFEEPLIETRHGFGWAVRAKEDLEE